MGYKHPGCACVELPARLLGRRGGCPHDQPRPRPGVCAEAPRSRVTVMARHVWAVRDSVYLLGEEDGRSMRVRAMISRIGPDHLVHHPGDLGETGEKRGRYALSGPTTPTANVRAIGLAFHSESSNPRTARA